MDEKVATEEYNLFLSWSGERSRIAAEAFNEWITQEQSRARPWISTKDMPPGKPWFSEIASRLKLKVGVVFVTPENSSSAWLNFETGAIFNNIGKNRRTFVSMLVRFSPEGLSANHPLAQLQSVRADEAGCRSIYVDMAEALTGRSKTTGSSTTHSRHVGQDCWRASRRYLRRLMFRPRRTTRTRWLKSAQALGTQNSMLAQIARDVAQLSLAEAQAPAVRQYRRPMQGTR